MPPRNIVFFGSTGCGKSSIVNMLLGDNAKKAPVSDQAKGCTFENNVYTATIDGEEYRLFDTSGLDQGHAGTIVTKDAMFNLYRLLQELADGISLLVYCMRGPRITESIKRDIDIFHDGVFRNNVPIIIVVAGLEDHHNMKAWWGENEETLQKYKLEFNGHACITASRGKEMSNGINKYKAEYDESRIVLQKLIVNQSQSVTKPWTTETTTWFAHIIDWFRRNISSWTVGSEPKDWYNVLIQFLPAEEAREIADRVTAKKRAKR